MVSQHPPPPHHHHQHPHHHRQHKNEIPKTRMHQQHNQGNNPLQLFSKRFSFLVYVLKTIFSSVIANMLVCYFLWHKPIPIQDILAITMASNYNMKKISVRHNTMSIYLQAKMIELSDELDLANYLMKPVQRLDKYVMLLKDITSCCDPEDPRGKEIAVSYY